VVAVLVTSGGCARSPKPDWTLGCPYDVLALSCCFTQGAPRASGGGSGGGAGAVRKRGLAAAPGAES